MIAERQFLNFFPPKLDGDMTEDKRRYMIVSKNISNDTIEMINISKIYGKNTRNLLKDYNVMLDNHSPLKLPSFAKVNVLYTIKYFPELDNFISFNGQKLNENDFNNILSKREEYIESTGINKVIHFEKEEFLNKNLETLGV